MSEERKASDWGAYPHRVEDESKLGGLTATRFVQYQNAARVLPLPRWLRRCRDYLPLSPYVPSLYVGIYSRSPSFSLADSSEKQDRHCSSMQQELKGSFCWVAPIITPESYRLSHFRTTGVAGHARVCSPHTPIPVPPSFRIFLLSSCRHPREAAATILFYRLVLFALVFFFFSSSTLCSPHIRYNRALSFRRLLMCSHVSTHKTLDES